MRKDNNAKEKFQYFTMKNMPTNLNAWPPERRGERGLTPRSSRRAPGNKTIPDKRVQDTQKEASVSYTHLTLPTIYSV